jgi:hypothetical protein
MPALVSYWEGAILHFPLNQYIMANTSAVVFWQSEGSVLLKFDDLGPFPGAEL